MTVSRGVCSTHSSNRPTTWSLTGASAPATAAVLRFSERLVTTKIRFAPRCATSAAMPSAALTPKCTRSCARKLKTPVLIVAPSELAGAHVAEQVPGHLAHLDLLGAFGDAVAAVVGRRGSTWSMSTIKRPWRRGHTRAALATVALVAGLVHRQLVQGRATGELCQARRVQADLARAMRSHSSLIQLVQRAVGSSRRRSRWRPRPLRPPVAR